MRSITRSIIAGCTVLVFAAGAAQSGEDAGRVFDYAAGIFEYYAGYCDRIGIKEMEEAYILLYPDQYMAHAKNEDQKQEDLAQVGSRMQKAVAEINRGTHEYKILLRAQLGEYDHARQEFKCNVVDDQSCLEIGPVKKDADPSSEEGRAQSIIARGLLFNKINFIRLFFVGTEKYAVLKCPAGKAKKYLKNRTDADGRVAGDIYVVMHVQVLPGEKKEYKEKLDAIRKNLDERSMAGNYVMLAKINGIEVYGDGNCTDKLGEVESNYRTLELQ